MSIHKVLVLFVLVMMPLVFLSQDVMANQLPSSIAKLMPHDLAPAGKAMKRKYGFRVYEATLWAPDGVWQDGKSYALQLQYKREIEKETLVGNVMDNIREQQVADNAALVRWEADMNAGLTAVGDGDELIALSRPGKHALLFLNGKQIMDIADHAFSDAFFNIWFGPTADEDMRAQLTAHAD